MSREPMQVAGVRVSVTVPARWSPERIERELLTCISFGSPEITVISNVPVAIATEALGSNLRPGEPGPTASRG